MSREEAWDWFVNNHRGLANSLWGKMGELKGEKTISQNNSDNSIWVCLGLMDQENTRCRTRITELEGRLKTLLRRHVLTANQAEVLYWSSKGLNNRQVSQKLKVTEQRISNIRSRLRQLGVIEGV